MNDLHALSSMTGIPTKSFADAVFNRYAERLMRVAANRLSPRLQAKVSPEDVVQSAFKSFFRRQSEFHFDDEQADGLWGLLVVITLRKCAKWSDVFGAAKRDVRHELFLHGADSSVGQWHKLISQEPAPEEAAMLAEMVEWLMSRLEPRQRQIISLRMQGYELEEIAQQVQSSRRTVCRVIAEAKSRLQDYLADPVARKAAQFPS